ncbi:hypothetical protein MACK_004128 [Theileria orientalis]|uniref:Uncharacterized protein n=1 Tax=Theileria orientalis TaxID=68886 RepID=A0A976SK12_THEOR|nr:hypothetical protein MACK_004128 [Theileria orientalis]
MESQKRPRIYSSQAASIIGSLREERMMEYLMYYTILYIILLSQHSGVKCNPTGIPEGSSEGSQIIQIDIAQKEDVTGIKYERDDENDRDRFTAQEGYLISMVLKNGRQLFEITNEKYLDRVIVYKDSAGQRKLKFLAPGELETYGDVDTQSQSQTQQTDIPQPGTQVQQPNHDQTTDTHSVMTPSQPGFKVETVVPPSLNLPSQQAYQVPTHAAYGSTSPYQQAYQVPTHAAYGSTSPYQQAYQVPTHAAYVHMPQYQQAHHVQTPVVDGTAIPYQSTHQVQTAVAARPRLLSQSTQVQTAVARRPRLPYQQKPQQIPQAIPRVQTQTPYPQESQFIVLNVKHMASTDCVDYCYYENEDVHMFVCKPGYLVGKLMKNDRLIHEYQHDHPDRAIIFRDENGKQSVSGLAPGTTHPKEPKDLLRVSQDQVHAQQPMAQAPKEQPQLPQAPPLPQQPVKQETAQPQPQQRPDQIQLIELELNNRQTTDQILYEINEEKEFERYTCLPGFLISRIIKNGMVVREPEKNDLFNRAVVSGPKGQKKLAALLPGDIDKTSVAFELELGDKQTTEYYIYKIDTATSREKFTCKSGFLISKVLKRGNAVAQPEKGDYFDRAVIYLDKQGKKQLKTLFPGDNDDGDPVEPTAMHTIAAIMRATTSDQAPTALVGAGTGAGTTSASGQQPLIPKTGVRINVFKTQSTNTYKYVESGNIKTFIAEDNYGFNMVNIGNIGMWVAEDNDKLAKRVDYSTNSFTKISEIRIDLFDGNEKRFVAGENEVWKEATAIKITPLTVNIRTLTSNDMYESSSHGNYRNFMAKSGWAFNRVIESGCYFAINASDNAPAIWQAEDRNEYAVKIIRDGASLFNEITEMTIYLINGEERKFKKSGDKWVQLQPSKPNAENI